MKRFIRGTDGRKIFCAERTLAALLKLPPMDWPAAIAAAKLSPDQHLDLSAKLDRHAEACAALSGFLDHGPRKARTRRRAVSRALGYTYPERRGFPSIESPFTYAVKTPRGYTES